MRPCWACIGGPYWAHEWPFWGSMLGPCCGLIRNHHVQCSHAHTLDEVMHFPFAAWPNEFVRCKRIPNSKLENTLYGYRRSSVEHGLTADMQKLAGRCPRESISCKPTAHEGKQKHVSKLQAAALFEELHGCRCSGILCRELLLGGCNLQHLRRRR
jgi:hypothetical protein